jgi:hypothetical protein
VSSSSPTELILIGTLHAGHNTAKRYTPEALRQILLALRPHRFCVEGEPEEIAGDGYARIPANLEAERARMPEGVVLGEVSRQLGIRWLPFDREGHHHAAYREEKERMGRANSELEQLLHELAAADPTCAECGVFAMVERAEQSQVLLGQNAAPDIVNSDAYDNAVRIKHSLFTTTLLPLLAKHEGHAQMLADWRFVFDAWEERNTIMANNLTRICDEYPGERLVVVTGAEHRYALRDRLAGQPGIALKEF